MLSSYIPTFGNSLKGRRITVEESARLTSEFSHELAANWLLQLLQDYPICTARFKLSKSSDLSGKGVDLRWLTPYQIIDEAKETYPGITALKSGYLPIGMCLAGRGDPYFLKMMGSEDSPVVRILHDCATDENELPDSAVELVSESLENFFRCWQNEVINR